MDAIAISGVLGALAQSHLAVVTNATRAAALDNYGVYRDGALLAITQVRAALDELERLLKAPDADDLTAAKAAFNRELDRQVERLERMITDFPEPFTPEWFAAACGMPVRQDGEAA